MSSTLVNALPSISGKATNRDLVLVVGLSFGRTLMKLHRLFPLLLIVFAVPSHGQVRPQARVGSLLLAVSDGLDHYEQLAPSIRCEDATEKTLRDSCKIVLEMLGKDVKDAREKIAHYN